MTVPRLQGWYDEMAPAVKSLSETFQQIFQPNKKFQLSVREHLAANPHLIQQYADLAKNNPELWAKMGLGPIGDIISGTPESLEQVKGNKVRNFIQGGMSKEQEEEFLAGQTGTMTPAARTEQQQRIRAGDQDYEISNLDKIIKESLSKVSGLIHQSQGAQAQQTLLDISDATTGREIIKKHPNIFEAFKKGLLAPEEARIVTSNPYIKSIFDRQMDIWQTEDAKRFQLSLNNAAQRSNIMLSAMMRYADEIADASGGLATPTDVLDYNSLSPDKQKELRELATPPDNPAEAKLWGAAYGAKIVGEKKRLTNIKIIVDEMLKGMSGPQTTIRTRRGNMTDAVNQLNNNIKLVADQMRIGNYPVFEATPKGWFGLLGKSVILKSGSFELARGMEIPFATPNEASDVQKRVEAVNNPATVEALTNEILSSISNITNNTERDRIMNEAMRGMDVELITAIRKLLAQKLAGKK